MHTREILRQRDDMTWQTSFWWLLYTSLHWTGYNYTLALVRGINIKFNAYLQSLDDV